MTATATPHTTPAPNATLLRLRRIGLPLGGMVLAGVVGHLVSVIFASGTPLPAYARALVFGAINAMFAIGLVLIYRAARIINFALGAFGVVGASLFSALIVIERWSFFIALPVAVLVAALTGLVVELLLIRRMAKASRLALTVVTIGLTSVLLAVAGLIPGLFLQGDDPPEVGAANLTPFSGLEFEWFPITFTGNHLMVVVVAALVAVGMAAFFRFTDVGIAVRAASENDDRAALLGINVNNLSSLVWVIAGALAALAAILNTVVSASAFGADTATAAGVGFLLRALAAAVVGRMENLPVTVAAALAISIFEEGLFWAFDDTLLINVGLLALIVVVLIVQKGTLARTDEGAVGTWAASVEIRETPHELRNVPAVRAGRRRFFMAIGAVLLAWPWVMSTSQTSLGSVYLIWAIIVISVVVLTGWGGQISLGQFGFAAIGAAVGGTMTTTWGVPFLIALPLASMVGAAVAVGVGLPAMRIKGLFLAVTTLAFAATVSAVVLNPRYFGWLVPEQVDRPRFLFIDTADGRVYYYLCLFGLLFALWVAQGLRHSRAGRVLIAMRDNERTAQAFSINRVRTRLVTFAISGFLASFAGVLLAHQARAVRAAEYDPTQSINIFLVAIIGGLGSVPGALTGVAYIAAVNIFVPSSLGQLLLSGLGVIAVLIFHPPGLGGLLFRIRDAWLRRIAMRSRIFVPSLVGDYRVLDGTLTRAALAPKLANGSTDSKVELPVRYRIPSAIGVRGESQQGRGWRWE